MKQTCHPEPVEGWLTDKLFILRQAQDDNLSPSTNQQATSK